MQTSKLVARYVGSMAGIGTAHLAVAYYLVFRVESLSYVSDSMGKLVPFLEPLPKSDATTWWHLGGLYLAVQGLSFGLAAAFSRRSSYRVTCFFSSTAAATAMGMLFLREGRWAPFFFGGLWQLSLSVWVGWLLLLEVWMKPFSSRSAPSTLSTSSTQASV
jgi:hypothetical protein